MPRFTLKHMTISCLAISLISLNGCYTTTQSDPSINAPVLTNNTAENQASETLNRLLDTIWNDEMAESDHELTASKIPDISLNTLQRDAQQYQNYINALNAIDKTALNHEEQITLTIQIYRLQNYVDEFRYNAHFVPLTSEYGFHSSLLNMHYRFDFNNNQSIQGYINTLNDFPAYFAQQIAYMRQGMAVGQVQPKAVMEGFEASVAAIITDDPLDSPFMTPLMGLERNSESLQVLKTQAMDAIANSVNVAYQAFYDFLVNEYIPQAKTDIAVASWPEGYDFYQNRIKHYTTLDMTADEIHTIGLKEVARIRNDMQGVLAQLDFKGTINEFIDFLRTNEQFYAQSPDELIDYAMVLSKRIDALLPKLFNKLPRTPYGVAPVPDSIAPKYTTGRYVSPRNDRQPGYYWVNTYALDKRPLYALPALTLHEAVPGHHLQISLAREMTDLPHVRRSTYISAFGEGWGLYSEFLGKEVGFYETPYDEFGRLSYEMWRACRLVVDTGMHVMGWTRQQALDYMLENTALSEHNVTTEIDRYISWPGQALSYKLGEIKIKDLRAKATLALGDDFDLREFHAAVLAHGSVPLTVLEQNINMYIERKLTDPQNSEKISKSE